VLLRVAEEAVRYIVEGIGLAVLVGQLLQFQRPLFGDTFAKAKAQEEDRGLILELLCARLSEGGTLINDSSNLRRKISKLIP
jgi:hypothetical protein